MLALADAIPEDKYDWRPADGVRSVGEVFLHVAGGNYYLVGMTGVTPPADVPKDIEEVTGKKAIREWMEKSFAHVHAALAAATPETMSKEIDFFGNKTTGRGIFLADYGHMSEHLGQAIAYARSASRRPGARTDLEEAWRPRPPGFRGSASGSVRRKIRRGARPATYNRWPMFNSLLLVEDDPSVREAVPTAFGCIAGRSPRPTACSRRHRRC